MKSSNFTPTEKKSYYDDYARFLVKWGLLDSAISLCYKKLSLIELTMDEEKETMHYVGQISGEYQNLKEDHKGLC